MAAGVSLQEVRVEETLKLRIGEAKNLLPRKEPRSGRNSYCVVTLDQEQVFRTATVEKSLNPFFGEDIHFEVPRDFRSLCFYLYDTDLIGKDTVLGKVAIKKENLHKFYSDTWFDLVHVHADTEVQGRIHLELKHFDGIPDLQEEEISSTPKLRVRILECSDIFACSGGGTFSDSFVSVTVIKTPSRSETKKTRVKKRTVNPQFEESFLFDIPYDDLEDVVVRCALWSSSLLGEDVFLGEVRIPLTKCDLTTTHEGWYWLGPRTDRRFSLSQHSIGSLRVKIYYTEDNVFPSAYYDPLREAILNVDDHKDVTTTPSFILSEIVKDKLSAARSLVRVFSHHDRVVEFIKSIVDYEVETTMDPNTLFRGNSLATKAVDEFMKHAGMQYLHDTIKHLVDEIFEERKSCEIDPSRLRDGQSLETNLANLQGYVDKLFTAITCSTMACPSIMCQVFFAIKDSAERKFPDESDVRYTAVSGFVFLRFFAPAILNPKLFQMRSEHPDPLTSRTLTLASKAIQSLGNLVSSVFCGQVKEPYMESLKAMILDEHHILAIKGFLDAISSSVNAHGLPDDYQIVLKEGYLIKRAQGRSRFGFKNYKKRFFVLTNKSLTYYKAKDKGLLCSILSADIKGVEKLGEESFNLKLMFQILQPDKPLYIQANNSVEEREWMTALRKLCQSNTDKLQMYHPEAYVCGRWLCCKERLEKSEGCQPVTEIPQPKCVNVVIDCDREIERIHSLFLFNLDKLDELQVEWESRYESSDDDDRHYCKAKLESINVIRSHIISLEQEHKQYRKITHRLTRHGSKKCPWGPTHEELDPIHKVTL